LKLPVGGAVRASQGRTHSLGSMQRLKAPMHRYSENELVDYLVVRIGSAGGVLIQRLARAGFSVIGLEAGPFWDTERDWVSDEAGSHKLYWEDLRITGGMGGVGIALIRGCTNLGIGVCAGGPVAILAGSRADRPHCIYRGFCLQGCKVGAKASTLVTHVPDALKNGAEIRDRSMAGRIELGKNGRVDGVSYYDSEGHEHFQKAKAVIVAGYAIETPRLLLNSARQGHENGLANSSDTVGRYLMVQAGNVILGRFEELVLMYKAPPAHAMTKEFYETDPKRDFVRGFAIQTVSPLPISFAKHMMAAKGVWGWGMRRVMMDYNHWAAFGLLGEGALERDCRHRPVPYLNNVLEQDHRAIKRRINASQHFRSFWDAWRTIAGYEAIHMIRKSQACGSASSGGGRFAAPLHCMYFRH
jgi:GMC oxidoreductase/DDE domain